MGLLPAFGLRLCVFHGAKFQHMNNFPVPAMAFLPEENRARSIQLDHQGNEDEQWGKQGQDQGGEQGIDNGLNGRVQSGQRRGIQVYHGHASDF